MMVRMPETKCNRLTGKKQAAHAFSSASSLCSALGSERRIALIRFSLFSKFLATLHAFELATKVEQTTTTTTLTTNTFLFLFLFAMGFR